MSSAKKVQRAAAKAAAAREGLERAMREAQASGLSLRAIAHAAGMSHEKVRQILSRV